MFMNISVYLCKYILVPRIELVIKKNLSPHISTNFIIICKSVYNWIFVYLFIKQIVGTKFLDPSQTECSCI